MKPPATYQQLRGGYYTPLHIAEFLSSWAIRSANDRVLEPSCGDGVFVQTAAERLMDLGAIPTKVASQIAAYEIDNLEAANAAQRLSRISVKAGSAVCSGDFFSSAVSWNGRGKFDAVVGNPPFIRYQQFPEEQREKAFEIMRRFGLRPNGLTNAWVPFVVAAAGLLTPTGRLAMVAPAELLQVNYAAELRLFLTKYFDQIRVITFRGLPFPGIQQEVILLLAAKGSTGAHGIELLELKDATDLFTHSSAEFGSNGFKAIDHGTEKWIQYYLSQDEINLIRALRCDSRLTRFGDLADTDVGIVTGMNDIFVLSEREVAEYDLAASVRPLVGRSAHLVGTRFTKSDWKQNARAGNKAYLLSVPAVGLSQLPGTLVAYLKKAERNGLHLGYKCRIRKQWYVVPSVYVPDAFMLRQIHLYPKLVANESGATCTDTIHRVRFKKKVNRAIVVAAFLNSLTFAFSEILGRSYGGGVLELEPNEADALPVPLLLANRLDPKETDKAIRSLPIENILKVTDKILLGDGLGLDNRQIEMLRSIWLKLQQRRTGRKNGKD